MKAVIWFASLACFLIKKNLKQTKKKANKKILKNQKESGTQKFLYEEQTSFGHSSGPLWAMRERCP